MSDLHLAFSAGLRSCTSCLARAPASTLAACVLAHGIIPEFVLNSAWRRSGPPDQAAPHRGGRGDPPRMARPARAARPAEPAMRASARLPIRSFELAAANTDGSEQWTRQI
jgi:hypothetical protein